MDGDGVQQAVAPAPDASRLCPGTFGHGDDARIPDTPLSAWNAQVEALLKECRDRDVPGVSSAADSRGGGHASGAR